MALRRMVLEIGMGTDIRGTDYTKAAVRALRDALWHNSLTVTHALGVDVDSMRVEVTDRRAEARAGGQCGGAGGAAAWHRHGEVVEGGLEIPNEAGTGSTVMAHAAAVVRLDLPEGARGMTARGASSWRWAAGNDLHGGDYTKAALRAVQDALHHSSLSMLRVLQGRSAAPCWSRSPSACSSRRRWMRKG